MERKVFEEIAKKGRGERESLIVSMQMLARHCPIALINGEDNKLFYQCKVDDILSSAISEDELSEAVTSGWWELSANKENLILKF